MIFTVPGHIEMIRNGLQTYPPLPSHILPKFYVKTQTRRVNRGIYQVGKDYAVQSKRGAKAEEGIRIVMDEIWIERYAQYLCCPITEKDALAEGGYSIMGFETLFRELNPKWKGKRWAFGFHVIEV